MKKTIYNAPQDKNYRWSNVAQFLKEKGAEHISGSEPSKGRAYIGGLSVEYMHEQNVTVKLDSTHKPFGIIRFSIDLFGNDKDIGEVEKIIIGHFGPTKIEPSKEITGVFND